MSEATDLPEKNSENVESSDLLPFAGSNTEIKIPSTSPDQKTTEMEVHHHGHVPEKKKWKEYIFQFFMLILAVFLGSYAETIREDISDSHKGKDYIASMIQDIRKDTALIDRRSAAIFEQIEKIDSIQTLFGLDLKNDTIVVKCYELGWYLFWYQQVIFNERTISQLISSGNMRLIKKKNATDSIMEYYNAIKNIETQKRQYLDYINLTINTMYKVYNYTFLRQQLSNTDFTLHWARTYAMKDFRFRTTEPAALLDLGATLENTKLVITNYLQQLILIEQRANRLIPFLKKEYNIKE